MHPIAGLAHAIPALPVSDARAAAGFYRERLAFDAPHVTDDFAVVVRDAVELRLWGATDDSWRAREDLAERPVRSGAESFIAGTASCRIAVADVDGFYDEVARAGILHPVARGGVSGTDFGTREFAALDLDGNLLTFFQRIG